MKRALPLVVAVVATTVFAGASSATAQVSVVSLTHEQPDNPGKADPPGLAKGLDKEAPNPPKADKSSSKPTPKAKRTPKATNPGKAKGHEKDKAQGRAVGHGQTTTGGGSATAGRRSDNENKKVTFCHVPPGNPANGHLITTSVNAITPGHTNHPGDIIPPFSFVKQGSTVTFAGQNWDAAGQAALANGCAPVAASGTGSAPAEGSTFKASPAGSPVDGPVGLPVVPTPEAGSTTEESATGISTTAVSADIPTDDSIVDRMLPNTGGARLAVLLAGIALVAGGVLLVTRRRRTA